MRRTIVLLLVCAFVLCGTALADIVFGNPQATPTPAPTAEMATEPSPTAGTAGVEILITAAGDVTLGANMKTNPASTIYTRALEAHGGNLGYFFANVYPYFAYDDLTLINFEGVLTDIEKPYKDNEFLFRAPPSHVQVLTLSSVEAVALENNHVMDFGPSGLADTITMLDSQGIVYAQDGHLGIYETKGVRIGLLAYQTFNGQYPRLFEQVPEDIKAAKESCDLVIVSYHWGAELDYYPNDNQIDLGRATVDAGADLVLGHHSHRINPIEYYNGAYIVYSLSNCSFSGNSRPSDMDTFLFQQKFVITEGEAMHGAFRIIPCSISSISGATGAKSAENDFAITPFPKDTAGYQRVIDTMLENGRRLTYAVESYPTEW
jgi:poly-gamma-glutamate synthesis protein (capsule biosynthesis protein)